MALQTGATTCFPHIEMDALFWGPKVTPVPEEDYRQRVVEALSGPPGHRWQLQTVTHQRLGTVRILFPWLYYPLR
jgi:hypothetical protein